MTAATPKVEFWFDVICPWCWMTSRWAAEVAEVRGFEIEWRPFSLQIINEKNESGGKRDSHSRGHQAMRVIEQARADHGEEVVGKLYTALGTKIHPEGRRDDIETILTEALTEVGLPTSLVEAAQSDAPDAELRRSTNHAMELAGPDVGIPIISIDGVSFFGPVVTPAPTGEMALRLWDGIVAAASVPGFYELKRGRTEGPKF